MDTIAVEYVGFPIHNHWPDLNPAAWAKGMWCGTTLSPNIHVLVGWDGLIGQAYDTNDEPGHWMAES